MAGPDQGGGDTAALDFFSCNPERGNLFQVRPGIPVVDALQTASCFLAVVVEQVYEMAEELNRSGAHSPAYLIEMAKAIVDSVCHSDTMRQSSMVVRMNS